MDRRSPTHLLELTTQQREQLEALARSRTLPQSIARRVQIVLLAAEGHNDVVISERLATTRETVGKWRRRFMDAGIAGLDDELRPGRPRSTSDEQVADLINRTLATKPKADTQWSCRTLAHKTGISKSTIQRIWKSLGLQPHRTRSFKISPDPFFVDKVREIVGLYLNPPDKALVLAVDEKTQIQALDRTSPMLPLGLGYVEGMTHDYVRHGTTTLFAALNVADGKILGQCKTRHRHQEFLAFLRHIEANVPHALSVHIILDNYATHKHPKVLAWLASRPRYHLHFTPTYASWLNQVEIWFNLITKRAIRRGSFQSVKQLVGRIESFIADYNKNSRPFSWTATADSIFEKLTRLCEAICGTRH